MDTSDEKIVGQMRGELEIFRYLQALNQCNRILSKAKLPTVWDEKYLTFAKAAARIIKRRLEWAVNKT